MSADIIQAQYEQLENIANRFSQEAENNGVLAQKVAQAVQALQNGAWEGQGAAAFFAEMETTTNPALQRLIHALEEAQRVTLTVKEIIRAAEEEAAAPFQGSYVAAGTTADAKLPGGIADVGSLGFMGDKSSKELIAKDPSEVFKEDYMENMIGSHFKGENSSALNNLMEQALGQMHANGKIDGDTLDKIADLRGIDRETFHQQYEQFENLWRNAKNKGDIDLAQHGNFMGSTFSLRYGKVVGDVFGMDPVFGSLLNPTGGLVGPDSNSYQPNSNDAIGYHGVFHDAAGYLYNNHDGLGPGYDYLGREVIFSNPKGNPLSGQVGGISWWASHAELNIDIPENNLPNFIPGPFEPIVGKAFETGLRTIRPLTYGLEGGAEIVDGVGDLFSGNFAEGAGDILDGSGTILGGIVRTGAESTFGVSQVNSVVNLSTKIFGWP